MKKIIFLLIIASSLPACTGIASLAQDLNDRQITSCIHYQGAYSPFIGISGLTATGGATISECSLIKEGF